RYSGPSHFRYVEQALHAGAQVDEGAELAHRGDPAGQDGAGHDRATDAGRASSLLLLEQRAPRDDHVPAAFLVFDDPELVDMADVLRRIRRADGIDLRERAERPLAADPHFVSAFHVAFDPAFDGEAAMKCVFELL